MKVLFLYENMNVLAGAVRAMLGIADYTKHLGHQVTVLAEKPTAASLTHYNIRQTRKYYPLPNLRNKDIKLMRIFDNKEAVNLIEDADLTWAFSQFLCRIDEHARCKPKRLWGYIHYPHLRSGVSINLEKLYCNGSFTLNAVKARMWPQSANAEVLYPHVPVKHYKNLDYSKRDIDVIVYSRVSPDKGFNLLSKLKQSLPQANIEAAGADLPSKPWLLESKPEAHYNLLFSEVRDMLARSKIYIHFRGFIMDPEHYGLSCAEAQSSGCVIVVHKSGGPYLDLLCGEQGKYGFYYETWDELVEKVKMVLGDEALWRKVSHDARGRVAEMMKQTESKLEKALGEKKL